MSEENNKKDETDMIWRFEEKDKYAPKENSSVYQHFTDGYVEHLVREVIQNSIDANVTGKVTRVNFTFGKTDNSFRDTHLRGKLLAHLNMENALRNDDVEEFHNLKHRFHDTEWEEEFEYLLIEDFETSGLNGNHKVMGGLEYDSSGNKIDTNNRFQKFYWDWGGHEDEDAENSGGSWGYGKAALTLASKIKTMMTVSTRNVIENDDSTLEQTLFGLSLIHPHIDKSAIPKPKQYRMYGYYCMASEADILPLSANTTGMKFLEDFKSKVGINRGITKEDRGLSILILWPVDVIDALSITRSVISNYSYAIKKGLLEVMVEDKRNKKKIILSDGNLLECIKSDKFEWEENGIDRNSLLHLNELLACSTPSLKLKIPDNGGYQINQLYDQMLDTDKALWKDFFNSNGDDMKKVQVDIPLIVDDDEGTIKRGVFETTFKKELDTSSTFFQRHVIRVFKPEKKSKKAYSQNIIALTEIDNTGDNELHKFLRKAEPPSHMEWKVIDNPRTKYWKTPTNILDFVQHFVSRFVNLFKSASSGEKVSLGWSSFATPGNRKEQKFPGTGKPPKDTGQKWPLAMSKIKNGLKFKPNGHEKVKEGTKLKIEAAFVYSKGNEFKNWEPSDFMMEDLTVKVNGVTKNSTGQFIITKNDNYITFEVDDLSNLEISISGFNENMEWTGRSEII